MRGPVHILVFVVSMACPFASAAQDPVKPADLLEHARQLLNRSQPALAFEALARREGDSLGMLEFDYLYGVAALDSGKYEIAVTAFERVLAVQPNHAGARMDLSRAYFMAGAFELAEAGFRELAQSGPPPAAREAITRYLEAIQARRRQNSPGWALAAEAGFGYDDNITGVPSDFGAAAQQSFGIPGIEPTGNSVKRRAPFAKAGASADYANPLHSGWVLFAGVEARARAYWRQSEFNSTLGEGRVGASRNDGPTQWRATAGYQRFNQEGAAPGQPKATNDRSTLYASGDWRFMSDQKTQVGISLQVSRVAFLSNSIEDFDQVLVSASWLRSLEAAGVPLIHLAVFATDDRARSALPYSDTTKGKNLYGARSYLQYSLSPTVSLFNALGVVARRDKDAFARSTMVENGRDAMSEAQFGLHWQFQRDCATRAQWTHARNRSNIDLYNYGRNEASFTLRCDVR